MNLVEVATFNFPNDTDVLESILQSEGIEYYLKDQNSSALIPGVGTCLSVRDKDVSRVITLIRQAGFESYLNEFPEGTT